MRCLAALSAPLRVGAAAEALAREGRDIINLGIGQPDFKSPGHVVDAADFLEDAVATVLDLGGGLSVDDEIIESILEDIFPDEIQSMEMTNMSLL